MFEHDFEFDPTYGTTQADLLQVGLPPEPYGFVAFWEATHVETLDLPLNLTKTQLQSPDPRYELHRVDFDTWGGFRIGSWLTVPADGDIRRGVVVGHGYGGREAPDMDLPIRHAVAIFPCAPGFHLSAAAGLPGNAQEHVVHGIDSREGYILRPSVAMLWSAASVLLSCYPQVTGHLAYSGGSFGGGLGALALPWDARFTKAHLGVPTFGHHPLRLQSPCVGSGEAVRRYHRGHPEVVDVLATYDAAVAASHISIPVRVSPALFDPAVPPPGQFAVANAIPDRKVFILKAGHFEYEETAAEEVALRETQEQWFQTV
ncbi:MAG: acetylxylan esterase [Anaerolineae bacterium]|nr:acetylxylan esterase [Anaerolineae bacterium]